MSILFLKKTDSFLNLFERSRIIVYFLKMPLYFFSFILFLLKIIFSFDIL